MARIKLILNVTDLRQSVAFYTGILGVTPQTIAGDSAFFHMDNPELSLEIRSCGEQCDLARLGIEYEDDDSVNDTAGRLQSMQELGLFTQTLLGLECYSRSPDGLELMFESNSKVCDG